MPDGVAELVIDSRFLDGKSKSQEYRVIGSETSGYRVEEEGELLLGACRLSPPRSTGSSAN